MPYQVQVVTNSTTQTSSPTYPYSQVSGTTNQASASFTFTGSTPSSAVFVAYESGSNSLTADNTNIAFLFTFRQEQLFHGICETDQMSSFLITHFGIVVIDLFYSLLMIPIFPVIK